MDIVVYQDKAPAALSKHAADYIDRAHSALERRNLKYELSADRAPTDAQRDFLSRRQAEISKALQYATTQEVMAIIARLSVALQAPRYDDDAEASEASKIYASALANRVSKAGLQSVALEYIQGKRGDGRFMPRAPKLSQEVAQWEAPLRAEWSKIDCILRAKVIPALSNEKAAAARKAIAGAARKLSVELRSRVDEIRLSGGDMSVADPKAEKMKAIARLAELQRQGPPKVSADVLRKFKERFGE